MWVSFECQGIVKRINLETVITFGVETSGTLLFITAAGRLTFKVGEENADKAYKKLCQITNKRETFKLF